jgi:hypothetical protein
LRQRVLDPTYWLASGISHRARQRLHRTHRKMRARGKPGNVCVVACARELSCFLWAAAAAP